MRYNVCFSPPAIPGCLNSQALLYCLTNNRVLRNISSSPHDMRKQLLFFKHLSVFSIHSRKSKSCSIVIWKLSAGEFNRNKNAQSFWWVYTTKTYLQVFSRTLLLRIAFHKLLIDLQLNYSFLKIHNLSFFTRYSGWVPN